MKDPYEMLNDIKMDENEYEEINLTHIEKKKIKSEFTKNKQEQSPYETEYSYCNNGRGIIYHNDDCRYEKDDCRYTVHRK